MKASLLETWICIASTAYANSASLTNAPVTLTNIVTSTNIVTLTNTVTLANTVTHILPANQANWMTTAIAILSACIALIAVFIAIQQFLLAKEKFRLDMFEKRFAVFKALSNFIYELTIEQTATMDSMKKLNHDTETAEFLFDDRITKCISQLTDKARDMIFVRKQIVADKTGKDLKQLTKRYEELWEQARDMETMLTVEFQPYLTFHNWKYGLIWPKKKKFVGLQLAKPEKQTQ